MTPADILFARKLAMANEDLHNKLIYVEDHISS